MRPFAHSPSSDTNIRVQLWRHFSLKFLSHNFSHNFWSFSTMSRMLTTLIPSQVVTGAPTVFLRFDMFIRNWSWLKYGTPLQRTSSWLYYMVNAGTGFKTTRLTLFQYSYHVKPWRRPSQRETNRRLNPAAFLTLCTVAYQDLKQTHGRECLK